MWEGPTGTAEEEFAKGALLYTVCLKLLHRILRPKRYLEIGVCNGTSLELAQCEAVGIDPMPDLFRPAAPSASVLALTSDDYFAQTAIDLDKPFDLIFIDGMHLFEFALRDFANAEKRCGPNTVIVFDDVLPNHPKQTSRERITGTWTGDVWKIVPILQKWRPDLRLYLLDTYPTGLLMVVGMDPRNQVLFENMEAILAEFSPIESPPASVLQRKDAISPSAKVLWELLKLELDVLGAVPPKLSVAIVTEDRESDLCRLLNSLSPANQVDLSRELYEIIVIENRPGFPLHSQAVFDHYPELLLARAPSASETAQSAMELALRIASSDCIGIFTDESSVATAGLLSLAMRAELEYPEAAFAVHALELSPPKKLTNLTEGYGPAVEAKIRAELEDEAALARNFEKTVFAKTSANGWFSLPSQTRAIFMSARQWKARQLDSKVDRNLWRNLRRTANIEIGALVGEGVIDWIASPHSYAPDDRSPRSDPSLETAIFVGIDRPVSSSNSNYHRNLISLRRGFAERVRSFRSLVLKR